MSTPSLTLYAPGTGSPAHAELIELLRSIELIGGSLGSFQFLAGRHFLKLISFLGCAPHIPLLPAHGSRFIRITIPQLSKSELFSGPRSHAPLCPDCKQPFEGWKHRIEFSAGEEILCLQCQLPTPIKDLNFRKRSCYSRSIIRIEPIFESEAHPANGFLEMLDQASDARFAYAYIG